MNQELSTTAILSLLDTTREQRVTFIEDLMNRLESGSVDPLKIHYQIKCMEKIIEGLTDAKLSPFASRYKELVLDAAEKYGSKEFDFHNSRIKIGEVGTKYDYSKTGDIELAGWVEEMAALKTKIDARQKMLQTIPSKGLVITDEDTGETNTVYPASKTSTTAITMTLK